MLEWVQQNGKSVRTLSVASSDYSPNSELFKNVVDALATSSAVTSVLMENCHTMSEIALLTSVQTLALEGPEDTVDLDPLQSLHGLQTLYLAGGFTPFHQGRYSCTALPSHLMSLCLYGTELFVETRDSHDTQLKKLGLYDSRLIVEHDEPMPLVIDEAFAELTGLTRLSLNAGDVLRSGSESDTQCIELDMPWQAMHALQVVTICGSLGFRRGLYDLLDLEALKHVKLDLHLHEDIDVDQAAALFLPWAASFAARPQVHFVMQGLPAAVESVNT